MRIEGAAVGEHDRRRRDVDTVLAQGLVHELRDLGDHVRAERVARLAGELAVRRGHVVAHDRRRVAAIELPVFVANGDSDRMILPRYSHLLAGLLPDARLTIYPDSAHGFLFQHNQQFAADVNAFLNEAD